MRAHQSTRFRSDTLLIFVALFGIFGGIVVFRSFANSRFDTTKPGIIALKDIRNNNATNEFLVHVTPNLEYCLKSALPVNYAATDYNFSASTSGAPASIRQTPQVDSSTPLCFSSDQDQPDVIVIVNPTVASLLTTIDISFSNK